MKVTETINHTNVIGNNVSQDAFLFCMTTQILKKTDQNTLMHIWSTAEHIMFQRLAGSNLANVIPAHFWLGLEPNPCVQCQRGAALTGPYHLTC